MSYEVKMRAKLERDYPALSARISALCEGEDDIIAKMATIACELYRSIDGFDWVGFYRVVGAETLKVGPYQGMHGCLVIPFEHGVCGAAARLRQTQIVDDVTAFNGHIACSNSTKSELVIPCFDTDGKLIAVLDIDSDQRAFFDANDADALEMMLAKTFASAT